jgi:chromosome condensin MukBEF complex kleisin-like MukF subunit
MDEKDVRIANLRAQIEGQEKTIIEQMEQIRELQDHLKAASQRIRELIAGIQEIIDRHKDMKKG